MTNEVQEIKTFTEEAYLNYTMYVILDRALPNIADGLKPVQRRIIYAMHELKLNPNAKYKKSARTVGDVLGKYHPHGDSACYEAMVLMAQPFSYKYPLIDGQGNWGAPDDPKAFAAMRYTESKLTKYSDLLLNELTHGTALYGPNFDGTLQEPLYLPAQVPNILLNGTTGIAVGMATDIPPHNLSEIIEATLEVIEGKIKTNADLSSIVKGPDYPTKCEIITSHEDIKNLYETGKGKVTTRALYHVEDNEIIISSLPYQASGARILEKIAEQMNGKKLPMVVDLKDESDHENPTRLCITLKNKSVDIPKLMSHLFATTDLEKSYRVNLNMIGLDGKPQVKSLLAILEEWLEFRKSVVLRRLNHRLDIVEKRKHTLAGLLVAYLNIDEVIRIIREEEDPKHSLMNSFSLSEVQANAILDTRLRNLARLEEVKIKRELDDLEKESDKLNLIINSDRRLRTLIKKELKSIQSEYGSNRLCPLSEAEDSTAFTEKEIVSKEPITIFLSEKGWIKSGKGHDIDEQTVGFKTGDKLHRTLKCNSNSIVAILGNSGRVYNIDAHDLPSLKSHGEPLTRRLTPPAGESFNYLIDLDSGFDKVFLRSNSGYGFVSPKENLLTKTKSGKTLISIGINDMPLRPQLLDNTTYDYCVCISSTGRILTFTAAEIPILSKGKGNKLMHIPKEYLTQGEHLRHSILFNSNDVVTLHTTKKNVVLSKDEVLSYCGSRGRRGMKLPNGCQNVRTISVKHD